MESQQLQTLASLRTLVGYLGEKDQYGWWQSSFFAPGSQAFLSPVFSRTQTLAQCNGVTQAAALIHDERIGVGHVYHLFRLPEDVEQGIHQVLHDPNLVRALQKAFADRETAMDFLRKQEATREFPSGGPIRVGDVEAVRDLKAWRIAVGEYLYAFEHGMLIFPYFSDVA